MQSLITPIINNIERLQSDLNKDFILITDTSSFAILAIPAQKGAFFYGKIDHLHIKN